MYKDGAKNNLNMALHPKKNIFERMSFRLILKGSRHNAANSIFVQGVATTLCGPGYTLICIK
jgi:hypothetical protein